VDGSVKAAFTSLAQQFISLALMDKLHANALVPWRRE